MTDTELQQIPILNVLPHRPPFVMVDRMMHYDEGLMQTQTVIAADNILVNKGRLETSGIIENMAQTCAARIGYISRYILHREVQIGVIGAISGFRIYRRPAVGETITTTIEILSEVFGMTLAKATTVDADHALIAEGELKISLTNETIQEEQ